LENELSSDKKRGRRKGYTIFTRLVRWTGSEGGNEEAERASAPPLIRGQRMKVSMKKRVRAVVCGLTIGQSKEK